MIFIGGEEVKKNERSKIKDVYVARTGVTGAPPWSQAWGWGSQASAWWPGLRPWGPAGLSPKERRGPALQWTHHLQEGSEGEDAKGFGRQLWAGAPAVQSLDTEPSYGDMECHLAGGEGA